MIGDPTGQTKTRPALSDKEIIQNAKTYQEQAFKILDKDLKKIEIVKNSNWLGKLMLKNFLETVATRFTIARILERDDFEKRMAENQPISYREFTYPLLQAYDSVMVKADIEIGGTDQKFNLLAGRDLQKAFGQKPQIVMTFPLLVGLDGTQKMSKSLGNYVAVNDSPKDIFGKLMSIPDTLMSAYFDLLTGEKGGEIAKEVEAGKLHPKEAKKKLASLIVESYYGKAKAKEEADNFDKQFKDKKIPDNHVTLDLRVSDQKEWRIVDLLKHVKAVSSTSEGIRLVQQSAVSVMNIEGKGKKITDPKALITLNDGDILKVGKLFYVGFQFID